MSDGRALLMAMVSEAELQSWVLAVARMRGWLVYHTFDSRRSEPGFPDLCMVRGDRVIFAELKSERGKVSSAQKRWLDSLERSGCVEVFVWRPSDMDTVMDALA